VQPGADLGTAPPNLGQLRRRRLGSGPGLVGCPLALEHLGGQ